MAGSARGGVQTRIFNSHRHSVGGKSRCARIIAQGAVFGREAPAGKALQQRCDVSSARRHRGHRSSGRAASTPWTAHRNTAARSSWCRRLWCRIAEPNRCASSRHSHAAQAAGSERAQPGRAGARRRHSPAGTIRQYGGDHPDSGPQPTWLLTSTGVLRFMASFDAQAPRFQRLPQEA